MRPKRVVLAFLLSVACGGAPAWADPSYTASDIVSHFVPQLGSTRSVCVGSDSECGKAASPPAKASGFDLVVRFDYNSDSLTPSARTNLDQFASAMKDARLSRSAFVVEGHTDGTGGDEFNLDLSMRRASSVVRYLEARGVPAARLEAKGYGKQRPLVTDPMSSDNRRVETRLRTE